MRSLKFWLLPAILAGLLTTAPALALDNVKLTIINKSGYPDNKVYLVFLGLPGYDSANWYHVSDWKNIAIKINSSADNTSHPPKDPLKGYADYSTTLDQLNKTAAGLPYFELPPCNNTNFTSSRLWICFNQPPYFHIYDSKNYSQPAPSSPSDPNYDAVFDFFEAAVTYVAKDNRFHVDADTSPVDFVGMPLVFEMYDGSTLLGRMGFNLTRKQLYAAFSADPLMQNLVTQMRVIAPGHGSDFKPPIFDPLYLDSYRDYCWQNWKAPNTLSFRDGFGNDWSGQVGDNNVLTMTSPRQTPVSIPKPSSGEIFRCDGALGGLNEIDKGVKNRVGSALNRHVFHLPPYPNSYGETDYPWGAYRPQGTNANKYYQQNGLAPALYQTNIYAKLLHQLGIDNLAYGFPYDDNTDQSTNLNFPCTEVRLTINNCRLDRSSTSLPFLELLME